MATTTHFRTCPLCEATCGLELKMEDGRVVSVKGDSDDVFSKGFICPKGTAVKHLHEDPDRLRVPSIRSGDGWTEATWDEAWRSMEGGLRSVIDRYGPDSVAVYVGNPSVHSLSATIFLVPLLKALGSKNVYTAATVDQMPKHVSSGLMFGSPTLIPVPDIDRTAYLIVLGANPWVSNGSLATAPDFRGRVEDISARGGKVVVVDPRRTQTAAAADEHVFIRPGTDAFFLLALAHVVVTEDRFDLGELGPHVSGLDDVIELVRPFAPDVVAARTGIPAETIRRIAREFSDASSACVYDRVGAHQQSFGTLASWASDVLNVITGNLDRPGGRMFPLAAHASPEQASPGGKGWTTGRFSSRVKDYPEAFGQLPVATLADEIETPGEGRVRALITIAGNPVLSTPNGKRLASALSSLEFMVSVDPFLNETTTHADVILPPPSILARHHYDFAFYGLSVRNVANYSPPALEPEGPDEWEILSRIALVASGQSASADPSIVPQMTISYLLQKAVAPNGALAARDPNEIMQALHGRGPVEQILDLRLRTGPYGDLFGARPEGLSLSLLEAHPHGIDLGPLASRVPNALRTKSGKIELGPSEIVADLGRLRDALDKPPPEMMLIGRRQLKSNNSWMHNVPTMLGGSNRCTMMVNPKDAERLGLADGALARIGSRAGEIEAPIEVTDELMPGVVSIPHGWGHNVRGSRLSVASGNAGVSANDITDEQVVDPLSGNAVLTAVPVEVRPVVSGGDRAEPVTIGSAEPT